MNESLKAFFAFVATIILFVALVAVMVDAIGGQRQTLIYTCVGLVLACVLAACAIGYFIGFARGRRRIGF